jgi:hypothetical protein
LSLQTPSTKKFGQGFPPLMQVIKIAVKKHICQDSQNLDFATSHFVIELLPFDYLSNQKQQVNKKMHFKRSNSSHSCRTFSTVEFFFVNLDMLNIFAV